MMHYGRANEDRTDTMNGRIVGSIDVQESLGLSVQGSLIVATQVHKVMMKAYIIFAFIS